MARSDTVIAKAMIKRRDFVEAEHSIGDVEYSGRIKQRDIDTARAAWLAIETNRDPEGDWQQWLRDQGYVGAYTRRAA